MNETYPTHDTPAPLDAFEERWVSALREPDADLAQSGPAFARGVMDRWQPTPKRSVLARIGWEPLAAAAALLLAALVGLSMLGGSDDGTQGAPPIVQDNPASGGDEFTGPPTEPAQPRLAERSEAERRAMAQQLQLGTLISDTSTTLSQPAAGFPKAISTTAEQMTLKSLTQGLVNPVPDPAEVLPPRRGEPQS